MKEHPQAELLRAIADGKLMQEQQQDYSWEDIDADTALHYIASKRIPVRMTIAHLRIKPATILVNGIKVPEPMRVAPADGAEYWYAVVDSEAFGYESTWTNHSVDLLRLQRGLCHTSEANAIAHAKAMLAPSMKGGE